jgi:hypothetical protein
MNAGLLCSLLALWFAQAVRAGPFWGWGLAELLIAVVVVAAAVALVYIALRQFKYEIPAWVIQVFWIVVVAFVVILAIRFVMSL